DDGAGPALGVTPLTWPRLELHARLKRTVCNGSESDRERARRAAHVRGPCCGCRYGFALREAIGCPPARRARRISSFESSEAAAGLAARDTVHWPLGKSTASRTWMTALVVETLTAVTLAWSIWTPSARETVRLAPESWVGRVMPSS